jgi:hypothetical protein
MMNLRGTSNHDKGTAINRRVLVIIVRVQVMRIMGIDVGSSHIYAGDADAT